MPPDDPDIAPAAPAAPAIEPAPLAPAPTESPVVTPAAEPSTAALSAAVVTAEPTTGESASPIAEPPAPVVESEKPKLHTDTPTLMEQAGTPQAEAPPIEPAAQQPAPISYEPYTPPEGLALDATRIAEADTLLAQHNIAPETRQALYDFHVAEMQRYDAAALQQQHDTFAGGRAEWVRQVMADPEIGGAGHLTAMSSIARMRDLFVSSAHPTSERYQQEMKDFNDFLRITGAGDHPSFNRMLHNVARKFDEPAAPSIPFTPPPDIGLRPNGAGSRRAALYSQVQGGETRRT